MKRVWRKVGWLVFWSTWPALWLYLCRTSRTRLLLICGDEFLAVKSWHGSGRWQLPGGGLHHREPSITGLIREVQEETGIQLTTTETKLLLERVRATGPLKFTYDCFTVYRTRKPKVRLQARELSDFAWLPLETPAPELTPDAAQALATWKSQG
jgi:8-oxo-dGTP pyrophosphatase MutT (NUDIX family)